MGSGPITGQPQLPCPDMTGQHHRFVMLEVLSGRSRILPRAGVDVQNLGGSEIGIMNLFGEFPRVAAS